MAAKQQNYLPEFLRRVRHALGFPVADMARKVKVNPSVLFRLEESEKRGTITMKALRRVAGAMDCQVVYAVVPNQGTLQELAEFRALLKRCHMDKTPKREKPAGGNEEGGVEALRNSVRILLEKLDEAGMGIARR
jgi:transcriptional regulator with XRE-family HTH domain